MKKYLKLMAGATALALGLSTAAFAQAPAAGTDTTSTKKHSRKSKAAATSTGTAAATTAPAGPVTQSAPATTAKRAAPAPVNNASASDIAANQAKGMVWVNTESKVYHKSGRWYGKTKQGKFMTESEAQAAGYKPAKAEIGGK